MPGAKGKYDSNVQQQLRNIKERRAYFSYYMMFCQIVVWDQQQANNGCGIAFI